MLTVNIADLKNNLSSYLRQVRAGEVLLVKDRDIPIARVLPFADASDNDEQALIAEGVLRPPLAELTEEFWSLPRPRVAEKIILEAIRTERDED